LSSDDSFADVTLVTDDKKQIKAHRNILSACSSVFKDMLQINTNNNHPVIYLRGIQHSEIVSILQFIYLGEAKFYEERTNEFLAVAKALDIRDLAKGIEDSESAAKNECDTSIETDESQIKTDDVKESINLDHDKAEDGQYKIASKAMIGGYRYECQQCDKTFKNTTNLKAHIKSIHDGIKYSCSQCDKQFTTQSSLAEHILSVHAGVKYACNQCDQQFTRQKSLTKHIQSIHEGVKYACNQCVYQATRQSNLTSHIQSVHEGVKYACNQCDYQAGYQSDLTKHIQSIHEGVKYACNQCDQQFTRQRNLTAHIKSRHEGM